VVSYLFARLSTALGVVLIILVGLVLLPHMVPGDPITSVLGPRATAELVETARQEMGFDEPIWEQVGGFVADAARGDLGTDFVSRTPVLGLIGDALPHTAILAVSALALALVVAVPLGVVAAIRHGGWLDRSIGIISTVLLTIPPYVAGLYLLLLFVVRLDVLPATGAGDLADPVDYARHIVMPMVALALAWVGYLARLVRTGMLEVLSSDHVRAARALGIPERVVLTKYALKNALIPTVAILGVGLGTLMGGAVFVELIFSRPGMGTLMFDAVGTRNYPVVRGVVVVVAVLFIAANLVADFTYRWLDPRARVEEA
jgi:peptide/nickel transport system permease protein